MSRGRHRVKDALFGNASSLCPLFVGVSQVQAPISGTLERSSQSPDGKCWFEYYATGAGRVLRYPKLVDFVFDPDLLSAGVCALPALTCDRDTVEHLFHNSMLPMLLADGGALMLHGAAIDMDGSAVVFIGPSGRGKSTLAASFAASGVPFLSDDSIRLNPVADGYIAQPGYPSVRLWRDSDAAVISRRLPAPSGVNFSGKLRYAAGGEIPHASSPVPLRAIYVLAREDVSATTITSLSANDALMEFVQQSFILDIRSERVLSGHFERMAALADKVLAFRLDYPRVYGRLPEVHAAILDHARSLP